MYTPSGCVRNAVRCGLRLVNYIERTKFNVDKDIEKRTHCGIIFDSVLEMRFFRDLILPNVESGTIASYELQKPYELQPKFIYNGKTIRPIVYVADFYILLPNGEEFVIDTKGCPDSVAKIKRKLFWYRYPNLDYRWVTYVKKFGGWIDYDQCELLRKEEKRRRKEQKENYNGKENLC